MSPQNFPIFCLESKLDYEFVNVKIKE